ncbi:MAG: Tol-Pal system beta propeller repeat protein TolB [Pseudomonadota bacterium]
MKISLDNKLSKWCAILLVACAAMPLSRVASAQLVIEITRGATKPIPVAIVPFAWQGEGPAPANIAGIVRSDFVGSSRFEVLDNEMLPATPSRGVNIDFDNWRRVAVDYIVVGELTREGDDYSLRFQAFDVYGARQIVADRLIVPEVQLRRAGHMVADAVFEAITGVKGVFATRVAYVSVNQQDGKRVYRLIMADADGNNERPFLEDDDPIMSPSWSPDGRSIAYVSFEDGKAAVYVQTLRTGSRRKVSDRPGVNNAPAWSPDGRHLALTLSDADGNLDVYVLTLIGNKLTRITERRSIDTEPAWSADGDYLYFTSDRGGAPQIYRASAKGDGDVERVTFEGSYNARPRVSPDGKWLAMVHNDRGNFRVAVQDLESGLFRVLSDGALDESPAFAPNSAQLIYATRRGGRGVLETVTVDGQISGRVKSVGGDVREPVWSPFRL